jgi:hypothetical protein
LLDALSSIALLTDVERRSVAQRLLRVLGQDTLDAFHAQLERTTGASADCREVIGAVLPSVESPLSEAGSAMTWLARLKRWQLSLFLAALGGGAAVGLVGTIDLIWQGRLILSGLGAVAFVTAVYLRARQHRIDESWVGS